MKKIKFLLLALISLFTSFTSFAQSYDKTTMIEVGEWNPYLEEWEWKGTKEVDFVLKFEGRKVYIDDAAKTVITTYGDSKTTTSFNDDGDHYTSSTWSAYDEKEKLYIHNDSL